MMAGMRAERNDDATPKPEESRANARREAAKTGSEGTLEDAVRRAMNDLEQELRRRDEPDASRPVPSP